MYLLKKRNLQENYRSHEGVASVLAVITLNAVVEDIVTYCLFDLMNESIIIKKYPTSIVFKNLYI